MREEVTDASERQTKMENQQGMARTKKILEID